MRTPLIAGNWKLNKSSSEAVSFITDLSSHLRGVSGVEVLVCPTALSIEKAVAAARAENEGILVGAQNCFWKDEGAYTGEISAAALQAAGVSHVIVGHSERRGRFGVLEPELEGEAGRNFGESNESVRLKVKMLTSHDLIPIICVGETLAERKLGLTDRIVAEQTQHALWDVETLKMDRVVFAYEPVWAIGTGETCASDEANRVCGVIRAAVAGAKGEEAAQAVRVQYGGSVKPDNARELLGQEHIDGALVGGASLKADSFAQIVRAAVPDARPEA